MIITKTKFHGFPTANIFNMILVLEEASDNVFFESKKMFEDQGKDVMYTKNYSSLIPIKLIRGDIDSNFNWYIGPNDYDVLKKYDNNIYESIYFGWGIFGWINRFIYFPLFGFLSNYFSAGLAVIFMTIITRLAMSPCYLQDISFASSDEGDKT